MLIVVTGAPAAGKSTWVRTVAEPGDLRFDSDAITRLLTGRARGRHHHDNESKRVSSASREAGIQAALPLSADRDVFVIHSNLSRELEDRYRAYGARFVIIDPGEDETLRRCRAGRPGYRQSQVRAWYARRDQWPADAKVITDFVPADGQDHTDTGDSQAGGGLAGRADFHVVIGPPCSGKSTFVRERAAAGDVVIDFDVLANALSSQPSDNHEHQQHIKTITRAARAAAIAKARTLDVKVWLIHSVPAPATLAGYRADGATIHVVDPGRDVVMPRCRRERPKAMIFAAAKWYDLYGTEGTPDRTRPLTTTEKGLGWKHQQEREKLLAVHIDGTPCWWCAKPMFHDKARNHDGQALAADHDKARHHGGTKATRLLHGSCNSSRQEGNRDDERPALALGANPAATGRQQDSGAASSPVPASSFPDVFDWPTI